MTAARRRMPPVLALAAALPFLAGCLGGTQNPSYFPWLLPAGDIVRTHAKPPGKGYFRNFDPNAFRLEVRPLAAVRPVGTEQVYIATVYDESGTPRRGRRVEWLLEGAGNIIEVDESGYLPGRGYKVDNRYAVSYTDYKEHLITRGNADPSDDFMIRPGQTWCVVSSAVEGETALTAYAPAVHDWDRHRVVVKTAWLDAQCEFPGGAVLPTGGEHVITSKVYRPSDRRPLADYRVRYRVLDGPPAVLLSHPAGASFKQGATEVVVASDAEGEAEVRVAPLSTRPGVTRVEVEVVRPSDPGDPNAGETVVARGVTRLEWRAADVTLTVTGPPEAPVGGEAPVTISVANEGQVPSGAVTVRAEVPPGWEYVRSDPPARPEGGALVWELPPLAGEQQHLLQARFLPRRAGKATIRAAVRTADGHAAQESATVEATEGALRLRAEAPEAAVVGETVPVRVTVSNPGTGAVSGVRVRLAHDAGLAHASNRNPAEEVIDRLGPGESRAVTFPLRATQPGRWECRASAAAEGNLSAGATPVAVEVGQARLELAVAGTPRAFLGQSVTWTLRARNAGELPVANVVVQAELPPEVSFRGAGQGGRAAGGRVQWALGGLAPGEAREVTLEGTAARLAARAVLRCDVTADPLVRRGGEARVAGAGGPPGPEARAEAAVEILGVPALQLEVIDLTDPLPVGARTTYRITVRNAGTLPADQVQVRAAVPGHLRVVRVNAPSAPRFERDEILFPVIGSLPPGESRTFAVEAEAVAPGDARFRAEAGSPSQARPVRAEEATRVLPGAG